MYFFYTQYPYRPIEVVCEARYKSGMLNIILLIKLKKSQRKYIILMFIFKSPRQFCFLLYRFTTMGKRAGHRKKYKKDQTNKKVKTQWNSLTPATENQLFKAYYQRQLGLPQQQFQVFWSYMKQKLPVVFRVNPNIPNYQAFVDKLKSPTFMESIVSQQQMKQQGTTENQPTQMPKLKQIDWYPNGIVFQLNTTKQMFKKSKILSQFHKYLQRSFDSGLVSRQQLVSMLPPIYLNIQPQDLVLDMCAAPGSKTSQILEFMSGENRKLPSGCVIANDADYNRAQMLIHQIKRACTAGIAAINHPGQFLPELYSKKANSLKERFQFDKILCDVPCSGDGATRKLPIKWTNWHTSDGMVLHPLQLAIVMKAVNLLKRGGLLVYSTCSLNPIQNEAVVAALMQKVGQGLQILDVHQQYGVKGHRGMLKWDVCTIQTVKKQQQQIIEQKQSAKETKNKRQIRVIKSMQQCPKNTKVKPSMFPLPAEELQKMGIQNTMRILPHDQNSGGFYVALFRKHKNFEWKYKTTEKKEGEEIDQLEKQQKFIAENLPDMQNAVAVSNEEKQEKSQSSEEEDEEQQQQKKQVQQGVEEIVQGEKKQSIPTYKKQEEKKKKRGSKYEKYINLVDEQFQSIKKFYGIDEKLKNQLYVRDEIGQQRKVHLVTESLDRFLKIDIHKKIKLVNMGCRVFEKGKESFAGHECLYRLCQDGIHFILDQIKARKVKVTMAFFKTMIEKCSINHDEIQDQQLRNQIKLMTQGSCCIYIDEIINGNRVIDAIVGQNFKSSFHLMVSKEQMGSLSIRYL